ncbi:MAG: hypothetical protein F2681_01080 [Actinobacteria bacterium]|uniref:Unannotated protein n=1 Tax=freshwater metagenome TaxID=449393 RepID=A0A6J6A481_9ZZZZ|nr:hypothetical protein [Actinomycetota bacterium]MSW77675.1 hypothetical protein [Actinomycetota bacterium]MSX93368.1 hypothetical protein [Actinomycetota bacterium]MSZ81717.1 hypothetical protein [Actinomycetota bacterium]MTB18264.1 hypothetical protein [Actinomycetota bacterium]
MLRPRLLLPLALLVGACADNPSATTTTPAAAAASTTALATTTTVAPAPKTIDELLTLGRPLVLAHTAGEDEFPASTMYAFGESAKAGVDMLDLNVMLSKDGVLVVQHDDTVDGSTNGTGAVGDLTYAQISALDDAYWFTQACGVCHDRPESEYLYRGMRTGDAPPPNGYSADDFAVPTFEQLAARFPSLSMGIEIKGTGAPAHAAADELARLLVALDRVDSTVISSFDDEVLTYFHSLLPAAELSPGQGALTDWVLSRKPVPAGMRILQLPPTASGITVITPQLVADSAAAGYVVWVWPNDRTLENLASYASFLEMGVTGLNINYPAQGVQAVKDFVANAAVATAASTGCGAAIPPGETTQPFTAAGLDGSYIRHLPPVYDGTRALPLVIDLHGWSESAAIHVQFSGLGATGDKHGFITITPAIERPVDLWNTSSGSADLTWLEGMLDDAEASTCIDTNRVFFAGMSNGAMMTSRVACWIPDRVAAAAPVAGVRHESDCAPGRTVPMIAFHGTDDAYLAYTGGYGPKVAALPRPDGSGPIGTAVIAGDEAPVAVPDVVAAWANANGCTGDPVDTDVADDVVRRTWTCPADGETVLYTITGGGHTWPGSAVAAKVEDLIGRTTMSISANELMWEFFRRHPLHG